MQTLKCVKCGTLYTPERERQWGRTRGSSGYGPRPVCTAIVPNPYAKKARRTGETPGQVCGGSLGVENTPDTDVPGLRAQGALIDEEPITARGRRR